MDNPSAPPSCNAAATAAASGSSGNVDELRSQLEYERELRLQHEHALESALDEVMERSRELALKHAKIAPTTLGSPQRLQSLAARQRHADEEATDVDGDDGFEAAYDYDDEDGHSSSDDNSAPLHPPAHGTGSSSNLKGSTPEVLQQRVASLHEELATKLQLEIERKTTESNALHETVDQMGAALEATNDELVAAQRSAEAAYGTLRQLLQRAGSAETCKVLEDERGSSEVDDERRVAWAERAGRTLLAWMEDQRRQHASAALREERLHAELSSSQQRTRESHTDEHARAERAEARCRHLVAALRATQRGIIDAAQGDMPTSAAALGSSFDFYDPNGRARLRESGEAEIDPEVAALRRRHRNAVWERQKAWAHADEAERQSSGRASAAWAGGESARRAAAMRDQLLLPGMRADGRTLHLSL